MKDTIQNTTVNFHWFSLLTVILVVMKLLKMISISWWFVFAPIWGPIAFVGVVMVGFLFIMALAAVFVAIFGK